MTMLTTASSAAAISINPATGSETERFAYLNGSEVETAVADAYAAFRVWRDMASSQRASRLLVLSRVLRERAGELAATITREMGKPIAQARGEIEKCAFTCEWYAEHGPAMLEEEQTPVAEATVTYLPTGLVFAVTPWNFPIWQIVRGAIPTILAGNAVLLKPAPNVVRSALNLRGAFEAAGFPIGVLSILNVDIDAVPPIIADRRVTGVALTGSVRAGSAVAMLAGKYIKRSLLELGGSDPFIVLKDADLDAAVQTAVAARFQNTGQVCVAAKRFIVERSVAEDFNERLVEAVSKLAIGDPTMDQTYIGPMARTDLRDELDGQVRRSVDQGARLLAGGSRWAGSAGNYYVPTILAEVSPGMVAFDEETFGPMAAVTVADDADQAIELANRSDFGLSAALWTQDIDRARALARRLETGGVFVNGYTATDPRVPVGGIKNSGYGRELSYFGVREFTNAQTLWMGRR